MSYNPVIDFAAIADSMQPIVDKFIDNQDYVIVIDPTKKIISGDALTGRTVLQFPVGDGPARAQKLRRPLSAREQTNDTTTGIMQFWIDFPKEMRIPDIRPGFELIVTNGGNDPYAVNYQYSVTGALNSSHAWQRTISTLVNFEANPNYQWSFLTGTISDSSGPLLGVTVTAQYQIGAGVWTAYTSKVTYDGTYRIPVFVGANYKLTFSKTGYTSQTTGSLAPVLRADVPAGDIVLS